MVSPLLPFGGKSSGKRNLRFQTGEREKKAGKEKAEVRGLQVWEPAYITEEPSLVILFLLGEDKVGKKKLTLGGGEMEGGGRKGGCELTGAGS